MLLLQKRLKSLKYSIFMQRLHPNLINNQTKVNLPFKIILAILKIKNLTRTKVSQKIMWKFQKEKLRVKPKPLSNCMRVNPLMIKKVILRMMMLIQNLKLLSKNKLQLIKSRRTRSLIKSKIKIMSLEILTTNQMNKREVSNILRMQLNYKIQMKLKKKMKRLSKRR